MWDAPRRTPKAGPISVGSDRIERIVFSPDGRTLALAALTGDALLWDVQSRPPAPRRLRADDRFVRDLVLSVDGNRLWTAGDAGKIIQWDWRSGQRVGSPLSPGAGVDALALTLDGTLLAAADYSGKITLWNVSRATLVGVPLVGHTNIVRTLAFSPDGHSLASGGDDGLVILWDVSSRQVIARLCHKVSEFSGDGTARTPRAVNRIAFSRDGKVLVAAGLEDRIVLWDVDIVTWAQRAYGIANRDFSNEAWQRYIGNQVAYRQTCPGGKPRVANAGRGF